MEKLLKWSIENANPEQSSGKPATKLDEKALGELFGAVDEPTQMKEAVAAAISTELTVENREIALDNLEMLIENLDNANNMENCQLWEPLLSLLDDESATIRKMTCWVVGTATQNNPDSQVAFGKKKLSSGVSGIGKLLELVDTDSDQEVRLKALYALSSSIGHCEHNYKHFDEAKGWNTLEHLFKTVDHSKLRMRILSFLHVLATVDPVDEKMKTLKSTVIVDSLIKIMGESDHVDAEEKALFVCSNLHSNGYEFTAEQVEQIKKFRDSIIKKSEGGVHPDDVPFAA